jgi:hypothetical protein
MLRFLKVLEGIGAAAEWPVRVIWRLYRKRKARGISAKEAWKRQKA